MYRVADRIPAPSQMGVEVGRELLVDALLGQLAEIAGNIREAIEAQIPTYRVLSSLELEEEIGLQLEQVLRAARDCRAAGGGHELAELAVIGETRAQQGIPVDEMLHAWHVGIEAVVAYSRGVSARLGIEDAAVLEFVQSTLAWSDVAMAATVGAHRRAELALGFAEEEQRSRFVRGALSGTIPAVELAIQAQAYGLDPNGEFVAIRALLSEAAPQRKLEWLLGFHGADRRGLSAVADGCVVGFLSDPPPHDIAAVVGVGPPKPLGRLAASYRLATRALTAIQACGLHGVYDIGAIGLRAAVAADADVGDALCKRYLDPLSEGGSARELIATLRAYLMSGMHVERTATRLFVHQNTVRYRLARFEELTGTSLRDVEVLFGVWWALQLDECGRSSPQTEVRNIGGHSVPHRPDPTDA
ncbi:PucR family transcriptional regulator [Mycolicibacter icosiumassiliensis]|uniref:PucR family transcriptional regulator n=1 Tax=Mycolicibacter icosiumassiliensis TaxID=1792835 RepID=UPI000B109A0C|nr:helix-turn-helix domain-containing protein [Mycolicibacter icosiumassiliensis]